VSGIVVLAEARDGALHPVSFELIAAARELSAQGAGPVTVALVDHDVEELARTLAVAGVREILAVPTPEPRFEAHVAQAAVEQLIAQRRPSLVLAGHTINSLGFVPAVAARGAHGFASDVTAIAWSDCGALARRPAYGERLIAELDFPGKETVVLLLRPGTFAAADDDGGGAPVGGREVTIEHLALELDGTTRSERVELREAPRGGADISKADFVLAIGRGAASAERVAELERVAARIGATLAVSGPLVEAGWAARGRKVGVSGKTVAPRVYLALGISGAAQHLAGMSRSRTIVAVNSDARARIFDVAHYGAVADLFDIAAELERQLGTQRDLD
jgi:electron transfer flavoprotein alpha subunit